MEVKVDDLTPVLLNYYTGLAKGLDIALERHQRDDYYICVKYGEGNHKSGYDPSHDPAWACTQLEIDRPELIPIMLRRIDKQKSIWGWRVRFTDWSDEHVEGIGHTIPEALCRLIIVYNYGETVSVPDSFSHLLNQTK